MESLPGSDKCAVTRWPLFIHVSRFNVAADLNAPLAVQESPVSSDHIQFRPRMKRTVLCHSGAHCPALGHMWLTPNLLQFSHMMNGISGKMKRTLSWLLSEKSSKNPSFLCEHNEKANLVCRSFHPFFLIAFIFFLLLPPFLNCLTYCKSVHFCSALLSV